MQYFNVTDAKQDFGAVLQAAQRAPVGIRTHNKNAAYVISPEDFEKLRKIKLSEFQTFCDDIAAKAADNGLTPEILEELLADTAC